MTTANAPPVARVLIVDDQPDNIEILARRLKVRRFEVLTAQSARDAGPLIMHEPLDIALLDWMMPGVSGVELLKDIRKMRSSAALPVIMLTARDAKEGIVEALAAGANDYVVKPFDFEILLARIVAQLKIRAAFQGVDAERRQLQRRIALREAVQPGAKAGPAE